MEDFLWLLAQMSYAETPLSCVCNDSSQSVAEEASGLPLETRELVHNVLWFGRGSL